MSAVREHDYPRVLLVTSSVFNRQSGGGITLSNLFSGWPTERIAVVHSDSIPPDESICRRYYRLGRNEIRLVRSLRGIHALLRRDSAGLIPDALPRSAEKEAAGHDTGLARKISRRIAGDGVPMEVEISTGLHSFISEFQPNLIYSLLGDLQYLQLVKQMLERYSLPLVVHMMDDWPSVMYRSGLFRLWLRRQAEPLLQEILEGASVCLGISEAMCEAYERRYGIPFVAFHNAVDMTYWREHRRTDYAPGDPFRLVYAGSIVPNAQLESLKDVVEAVAILKSRGIPIELKLHGPRYVERFRASLERNPMVRFGRPPTDDTIGPILSEADLLVLPVNFDEASVRYIRYSMPTKIPAYLASATPTLVYGPRGVAQVDYADRSGWGHTVAERGSGKVARAIEMLIQDRPLRTILGMRAFEVAEAEHDGMIVRRRFHSCLVRAALA